MKTLYSNVKLIFSGDTVLLVLSVMLFLASLANATHWHALRHCRFCGVVTTFFSLGFGLLTGRELFKQEARQKRTILAAIFFLAATALCLSQTRIVMLPAQ